MIPVTVTFFTKKSHDKRKGISNALLYGSFIFLIYILLSLPFHIAGNVNPEIFNTISTNAWLVRAIARATESRPVHVSGKRLSGYAQS